MSLALNNWAQIMTIIICLFGGLSLHFSENHKKGKFKKLFAAAVIGTLSVQM